MVSYFFENLSRRFSNENDLSDVTWVMAESVPIFRQLFVKFFFKEVSDLSKLEIFRREHMEGTNRVDFYIKIEGQEFVIECKVMDRNQHFIEYKEQWPKARHGYISNYAIDPEPNFEMRTWEEFSKYLKSNKDVATIDASSREFIHGYGSYLKKVCSIIELKKIMINNLSALYHFNLLVKKIVQSIAGYKSHVHNASKPFEENRSGRFFCLQRDNGPTIYPWLGVYYTETVGIFMGFDKGWCKAIFDVMPEQSTVGGQHFKAPYKDYEEFPAVWFELKEEYFELFNSEETTLEQQEALLRGFVQEVLATVSPYWLR
ncbi:MAG TPA: hypothetical protein VHE34_13125 [Puia sp.]|uniref:hypothetical protein n=1 Tax=Puia sp. TaxID=2045100 RepID=UPI002C6B2BF3|nr:hypothetical protein [Puia sp.]HVU96164.1 hypothetical protein [Puia sp.]